MASFRFIALDRTGREVAGVVDAASDQAALAELEQRALTPVELHERSAGTGASRGPALSARRLGGAYGQLADLLRAGVPLMRGLTLLASSRASRAQASVFGAIAQRVSAGDDLADAMADQPRAFPRIHVAMVRAGERGGFLEDVLARLGAYVLRQAELRSRLIGNLVYPAFLVVAGLAILGVIFGVFVPQFRSLFEGQPSLSWLTRAVLGASDSVGRFAPVTLVVVGLAGAGLWRLGRVERVRAWLDRARTRLPIVGPLVRASAAARFCRMLGLMLGNGVPMLSAMQIAREAAGNALLEATIERATEAVRAGEPLAGPLRASGLFDPDAVEIIDVAENANNLDQVLSTLAQTLESRVDSLLNGAVKLVEPMLLLVIAGAVVVVAVALVLPMTQMSSAL